MTKCKQRSMMLLEIERIQGEQLCGTLEAQRLAWPGVQLPGYPVQLVLRETTQVAALGQILPQQAIGVLVDATLPGTVWDVGVTVHVGCPFCGPALPRIAPPCRGCPPPSSWPKQ